MKDILFITPPFTQLNTPYPATSYLKGFLNTKSISSFQMDLGLDVILKLFSKKGLQTIFSNAKADNKIITENSQRIFALKNDYLKTIEHVVAFLQGNNRTLAMQICSGNYLPQASRFNQVDDLNWAFGKMGTLDKAKHLATLYLEDLSDFIVECIDENFGFSRYAEKLGRSANSFDELHNQLQKTPTFIDKITFEILDIQINKSHPKLICFSVPFPGNLYSAFRCAGFIKSNYPNIKIVMGGGFPTTELRSISDIRVFDFFDFITLDDGELPLELIVANTESSKSEFKRTFIKENGKVVFKDNSQKKDYSQLDVGTPDYSDLFLDKYISVIEVANPMHSLWSDGRWNKLTLAHGCYWAKCTFCDGSLDYIKNHEQNSTKILVDRIQKIIEQTGEEGFHFVDEAAPPALLRALAIELIRCNLSITWWTNIRFEKSFSPGLCQLLKESGCIAISGGLEVASDRLLKLINKGVTVEQVAQVTHNFTKTGIMVHAYLMYGFPSQTEQETVDSLEMVRQMFKLGIIQSGFWHQFALTAHSPIGLNSNKYGITIKPKTITFANNDIDFIDNTGIGHAKFSFGLKKSLYNYMHEIGFDFPLQEWFDFKISKTKVDKNFIQNSINIEDGFTTKPTSRIIWLGGTPTVKSSTKSKKGKTWQLIQLTINSKSESLKITVYKDRGEWLLSKLEQLSVFNSKIFTWAELKADYEKYFDDFELFWYSKPLQKLRKYGLLVF